MEGNMDRKKCICLLYFISFLVGSLAEHHDMTAVEKLTGIVDSDEDQCTCIQHGDTSGFAPCEEKDTCTEHKPFCKIEPTRPNIILQRDCHDLYRMGQTESGRYEIRPYDSEGPVRVWCDMSTEHGGWTVFQRRWDGSVDFNRRWWEYKHGFGAVTAEHWLGNDIIHMITKQRNYELRIELEDFEGEKRLAVYDHFYIGDEMSKYTLYLGKYSGTAGDSLLPTHALQKFSTMDADNDSLSTDHCSEILQGAWWFNKCLIANLNGKYLRGAYNQDPFSNGVIWKSFRGPGYSLKFTEMKVRPL